MYQKGGALFAFNFHPVNSYEGCVIPVPEDGDYQVVMSTDDYCFGGQGRIWHETYAAKDVDGKPAIRLYLPSRTAMVLKKCTMHNA